MRVKQLFFPPAGTSAKVCGYGRVSHQRQYDKGNSIPDQETRVRAYYDMRQLDDASPLKGIEWGGMYSEPNAQSAFSRPFRNRPTGAKLWAEVLNPGDHLIIDKLDRIFRSLEDFCSSDRYFAERGIRLHFVNFFGLSMDTGCLGGWLILNQFAMFSELESLRISERVCSARMQRRLNGRHDGAAVPFFCEVVDCGDGKKVGGNGRLIFKPWALPLMEKIVQMRDTGRWWKGIVKSGVQNELTDERGNKIECTKPLNRDQFRKLYWFYRAWIAAGKPDPTTLKVKDFVDEYKRKQGGDSQP